MKRIIAILLCVVMLFALAGCGSSNVEPTAPDQSGTPSGEAESLKFGFISNNWTDPVFTSQQQVAQYTCEALGIESVFATMDGYDADAAITAVQNLIESGCDAIWAGVAYMDVSRLCEENGVVQMCNSSIASAQDDYRAYVDNMHYYSGIVTEDNYNSAVAAVDALYEAGCRNVGILSITLGLGDMLDDRDKGFRDGIAAHPDMNLVADYYGMVFTGEYNETVTQWLTMYPELDGILVASNDGGAMAAVYAEGAQDRVKLAVFDIQDGVTEAIKEGVVAWCALGQENTVAMNIVMAYNLIVNNNDMLTPNTTELLRPFLFVTNEKELELFEKLNSGALMCYDKDLILELTSEDATIEDIIALNEAYSFADIAARNGIALD